MKPSIDFVSHEYMLYMHTIMDNRFTYFSEPTREPTPHTLLPEAGNVFLEFTPGMQKKILPLCTIDLHALNEKYNEKIHVIYYESANIDWVVYDLDGKNKINNIRFVEFRDEEVTIESSTLGYFQNNVEDLLNLRDEFTNVYLYKIRIPSEYIIESKESILYHDPIALSMGNTEQANGKDKTTNPIEQYCNYENILDDTKQNLESIYEACSFGAYPISIQEGFYYPAMPGSAMPFIFVGSVSPDKISHGQMTDNIYHLFYHPETRTVVQYMQMT